MQDYIEAYNNALKDLYTALNSRSPTCWKTYWSTFRLFYISKITKNEYNKLVLDIIGEENVPKHNKVFLSLMLLSTTRLNFNSMIPSTSSPTESNEVTPKTRDTHKAKKKTSSKDILTYTDRLIKEDVPLLLQYYTSIAQTAPLFKTIKSTYQQFEASLSQKRPRFSYVTMTSPYETVNYSFSYSNHQIREIQRQYYSTLDEILEKILSLFDATIISNIHNKLPILKEAFNIYLYRILYAIKVYSETGGMLMRYHLKDTPSRYSNYIPVENKESLIITIPILRQVLEDQSQLLGPLASYHMMLLNTTHVRPEEIQMRDKLSLEENELNSLGGHKGEENDSENENIENLKNM